MLERNYIALLSAILRSDWGFLIECLTEAEIKENRIEKSLGEYKWVGDYAEDARYVYPNRDKLITTVIRKYLTESND